MSYSTDTLDFSVDIQPLSLENISLTSTQIDQAMEISDRSRHPEKRWWIYLNALALAGFEQWVQSRSGQTIDSSQAVILEPTVAYTNTAVCKLQVNGFQLCLIAVENQLNDPVAVPRAALESEELLAHFYVVITVHEEHGQVQIQAFLRRDQFLQYQQSVALAVDRADCYALPWDWFEPECDRLLLHLDCLDPAAISLAAPTVAASVPLQQILAQPIINMGRWFNQHLTQLAQGLDRVLLPTPEFAIEMRNLSSQDAPENELPTLLTSLARSGMSLSSVPQAAYRDFRFATIPLRLYVITESAAPQSSEWSLLLILKSSTGANLPAGLKLRVCDAIAVLAEPVFDPTTPADYLYTRVIGDETDQFSLTIVLQETSLTLPTFAFQPIVAE